MTLTVPFYLILLHYIADFILQRDADAQAKWKAFSEGEWYHLLFHTFTYSLCFLWLGWEFFLITFLTHTITDFFTAPLNHWLWYEKKSPHWFFVGVGGDQVIHYLTLGLTYKYLIG